VAAVTIWQAVFLGFLQGATELFPVSSLGHAVLVPKLLSWRYNQADPEFLPYVVLLHLGTAAALLLVFRDDWVELARAFVRSVYRGQLEEPQERLALLLMLGTVPAALAGAFFESEIRRLFATPRLAAMFLLANGVIMAGGELLRRRDERRRKAGEGAAREAAFAVETELDWRAAAVVGASQGLALLPGISRSGVTITGGLASGLRHVAAARFSFLLATPIILAAGVLEVPALAQSGDRLLIYLAGAMVAAVTAYLSARLLLRYFRFGRLDPFAGYCLALGVVGLLASR